MLSPCMNQQMVPQNISPKVIRLKLLVSRVRIVFMACGKKAEVVKMAAINPKFISKKDQGFVFQISDILI